MDNLEIVKHFYTQLEQGNIESAGNFLAEDFIFEGSLPQKFDKSTFLTIYGNLVHAFSDFNFHLLDLYEDDDIVSGVFQISGFHSDTLDLSPINGPVIRATGTEIRLSKDRFVAILLNEKITRIYSSSSEDEGIEGILQAIGSNLVKAA